MVIENCRNTLLLSIGPQNTKIKLNEFQFGKYIISFMSNDLIIFNELGLMKCYCVIIDTFYRFGLWCLTPLSTIF